MGRYKCTYDCDNSNDSEVKFFKFPLYNPRKLKKWLVNMKRKDWTPTRFSVLCIHHFEEQHLDRSGKCVTLREDAVPTIFSFSDNTSSQTDSESSRRKRKKLPGSKTTESVPCATTPVSDIQQNDLNQTQEEPPGDKEQKKTEKWRIIVDERLMMIESFPHFFHGHYCVPQNIQWAPDDGFTFPHSDRHDSETVIEVNEPWQWLGLDVRGPLPQTHNGHKYILTVTDFFSKWVEATPMPSCLPSHVAKTIADIIDHFGYPVRILSRLPQDVVHKINQELEDQLKDGVALVVYHQQTGTADLITPQLIDRMVSELSEEHAADWDVYLPARVFSLCFKEHSGTRERPFWVLCCKGREPVQSPREVDFTSSKIQDSVFVVR